MMGLKLVTAPTQQPVSRAEAKSHMRVEGTDEDTLIDAYIKAATGYVDGPSGFLGQALIDQTWDLYLDEFPDGAIKIPLPPLLGVLGVFYRDDADAEQTVSTSDYIVDDASDFPRLVLPVGGSWPTAAERANAVRVRFRSGFVDTSQSPVAGEVPGEIKTALLMIIGDLYEHRETMVVGASVARLPWAAEQLLRMRRKQVPLA